MVRRAKHTMPDYMTEALRANNVLESYNERPPYQQNDYIGWVIDAKRDDTRRRRLQKMINELKTQDAYMGMPWGKKRPKTAAGPKKPRPQSLAEFMGRRSSVLLDIAGDVNAYLMKIEPKFEQRAAWNGWAYKLGDNYSCFIVPYDDHIKLMIMRGVMLNDPERRLAGTGVNTRHVRYNSRSDVDYSYLKMLIKEQVNLYKQGLSWEDS